MLLSDEEILEFRAWKLSQPSPLEEAFRQLESVLERPYSAGLSGVMPTMAYRVLANAVLELKKEVMK